MAMVMNPNNVGISSAAGLLSLLTDNEFSLRVHALQKLNEIADEFWPEISESLNEIEDLYEDENFEEKELAALVLCKVYYHLEDYDEALTYALGVGSKLNIYEETQFVQTIVGKAIDEYIRLRSENYDKQTFLENNLDTQNEPGATTQITNIDPRLENIFDRILNSSMKDEKQCLGISIEARRIDKVEEILKASNNIIELLEYSVNNTQISITTKRFRLEVLNLISKIYENLTENELKNEYASFCQCLFFQHNYDKIAHILLHLIKNGGDDFLMALQIAFDIVEFENQNSSFKLLNHPLLALPAEYQNQIANLTSDETNSDAYTFHEFGDINGLTQTQIISLKRLREILSGEPTINYRLQFIHKNNKSNLAILDNLIHWTEAYQFIIHSIFLAHGFMQAGTTSDEFLRKNLEYFGQSNNWIKFSTTASLGVIYKGHINDSRKVLFRYLPSGNTHTNPYTDGGALYALGLIHANNYNEELKEYITKFISGSSEYKMVQHGACLALGLIFLGVHDPGVHESMDSVLLNDSAVSGESAAYGIGMNMLGSGSQKIIKDLLCYAYETQHEKIKRSCAVSVSMLMYRKEEEAEGIINEMCENKDPLIRQGATYTIGMAYCGTGNNSAVRRLLHMSVSDVSDDVRRTAVIALGFVLCNIPDQAPKILKLLTESYNPHVRYGAAMALGVSTSGTANSESVSLLTFLVADSTEFVRQGALISLALVLQQATEHTHPNVPKIKSLMEDISRERQEDKMTRFGAFISIGLIDAGGCNYKASIVGKNSMVKPSGAVGFLLFCQMWYWYPLIPCISLAFQPTAIIGLTKGLKLPESFHPICTAKKSLFDYPQIIKTEPREIKKGLQNTVLSIGRHYNKFKNKFSHTNRGFKAPELYDINHQLTETNSTNKAIEVSSTAGTVGGRLSDTGSLADSTDDPNAVHSEETNETDCESKSKRSKVSSKPATKKSQSKTEVTPTEPEAPEPNEYQLDNLSRVLTHQEQYIKYSTTARYTPILPHRKSGFIILKDNMPHLPNEFDEVDLEDMPKIAFKNNKNSNTHTQTANS